MSRLVLSKNFVIFFIEIVALNFIESLHALIWKRLLGSVDVRQPGESVFDRSNLDSAMPMAKNGTSCLPVWRSTLWGHYLGWNCKPLCSSEIRDRQFSKMAENLITTAHSKCPNSKNTEYSPNVLVWYSLVHLLVDVIGQLILWLLLLINGCG